MFVSIVYLCEVRVSLMLLFVCMHGFVARRLASFRFVLFVHTCIHLSRRRRHTSSTENVVTGSSPLDDESRRELLGMKMYLLFIL